MQIFEYHPPSVPWLDIRYVDRDIIIINKPSGLLSNPGRGAHTHDCALTRLQTHFGDAILVHRLDCATSGIMVFARNKKAESNLKTQFQDRLNEKVYIAEVSGIVTKDSGVIDVPIGADKARPPYQHVCDDGKPALTHYKVLSRHSKMTLVELTPETGRTHQLRVHMLSLGHPILGDDFYGDAEVIAARSRLSLHAQQLTITHPYSNKRLCFKSQHPF